MVDFNNMKKEGEAKAKEELDKRMGNKDKQQGQNQQKSQDQNQQSDNQQSPGT